MRIGIIGKKQAGKDTFGRLLIDHYDYTKISFADALKKICMKFFILTWEEVNDAILKETPNKKLNNYTPRQLMQELGTDWFRKYDDNIWIRLAEKEMENTDGHIVITDCRFLNEADLCDITIRINRPAQQNNSFSNHKSENALNDYKSTFIVTNIENDFVYLRQQADDIMNQINLTKIFEGVIL